MASTYSFDIESSYDKNELDHALDQSRREITQRYDFKGTAAAIDYTDQNRTSLTVEGDNEYQLDAIVTMLRTKLAKRGVDQKVLDLGDPEISGMITKQILTLKNGMSSDAAKQVSKDIREIAPKAKPQIQGEIVRVTSPKKDELQMIMQKLKENDYEFPLQFVNFR